MRYWDVLEAGEECTLEPSSSALILDESSDEATIVNYPTHVTVNKSYTAAGYSQGMYSLQVESQCNSASSQFTKVLHDFYHSLSQQK